MHPGAHLPLADFEEGPMTAAELGAYARAACALGYSTIAANDHLVWRLPWLDGSTALASVASAAGDLTLATSISLPVVRHPVVLAKSLATLAVLAEGRVVAGLGPGSSPAWAHGPFEHPRCGCVGPRMLDVVTVRRHISAAAPSCPDREVEPR